MIWWRLTRRWWREWVEHRRRLDRIEARIQAMERLLAAFDRAITMETVIHTRRIVAGQIMIERMHANAESELAALRHAIDRALDDHDPAADATAYVDESPTR